jgi:hypothetical protein
MFSKLIPTLQVEGYAVRALSKYDDGNGYETLNWNTLVPRENGAILCALSEGNAHPSFKLSDDIEAQEACLLGAFVLPSTGMKQMGETWFRNFLVDPQLHQLLEKVDAGLPEEARREGCDCGGKLHRADYERKARGVPQWNKRYSFCCDQEDCRGRRTRSRCVSWAGRSTRV